METGIEGLEFREDTISNNSETNGSDWLGTALSVFAWIELVCGIILAFAFGFVKESHYSDDLEFNAAMFFCILLSAIISFMILQAFSVFVKAANKYLNS